MSQVYVNNTSRKVKHVANKRTNYNIICLGKVTEISTNLGQLIQLLAEVKQQP